MGVRTLELTVNGLVNGSKLEPSAIEKYSTKLEERGCRTLDGISLSWLIENDIILL
jgi:hypothetical protein